jgi:hypothetical protein
MRLVVERMGASAQAMAKSLRARDAILRSDARQLLFEAHFPMLDALFYTEFALMNLAMSVVAHLRRDRGAVVSPPMAVARVFGPIYAFTFGFLALAAWSGALPTSSSNDLLSADFICGLFAAIGVAMAGYEFYLMLTGRAVRPSTTKRRTAKHHSAKSNETPSKDVGIPSE